MWWSYILNVFMGIVVLVTMLFCIGPLEPALDSTAPYLILFNNTGSTSVALTLSIILFLLVFSGNITALATTSREMWAFSRDRGFPFSKWISKVVTNCPFIRVTTKSSQINHKHNVPENAVYLTSVLSGILCLINLGSTFAFNIIVSLSLLALLSTYMISIGCVLLLRLTSQPLPPARWSLGRWGLPINAFAFCYSAFVIVFSCFPSTLPVTTSTANWAPAVWVGVMVLAGLAYIFHGKKAYTPPVDFVEGRKLAGVGLQGV
jgi:choline transport protein